MAVAGVDCAEVFGAAVWPRRARDSRRGRYVTRVGYAEVLREPLLARVGYATRAGAVAWPCLGTRLLPGRVRANRAPHSGPLTGVFLAPDLALPRRRTATVSLASMWVDEVVEVSRPSRDDAVGGGVVRFLAGSLAAGLAVLTVGLVVAELVTESHGLNGPGTGPVVGHAVASVAAIAAAVVADRRQGRAAGVAIAVVLAIVAAVLWFYWLT